MKTSRRSHGTLLLAGLGSLLLAACSGGVTPDASAPVDPADPVALIRSVSQQVHDIGSFRMTFDMRFEGAGQAFAATGDGEFFQDPVAMHANYRFDELPGMPSGAEMEMILDGSTFYMRMPELAGSQGLPTEWISMDINEVAPGFDNLVDLSRGQNDPTSSLAYLEGITDAEAIGTETVAGVETTHYAGTVDLNEAVDQLSGDADASAREALAQATEILGKAPMPVDVWIDDEGLLRRMSFSMAAKPGAAVAFSMEMTMEIPEYGIDLELPIPPAEDITDLAEMIPGGGY